MNERADDLAALARQLTEPGPPPTDTPAASLSLAWALKDLCYQCWNTDPPRAVRAAEVLGALQVDGLARESDVLQAAALADWTAGIAALIQGRMNDAVAAFDRAAAGLAAAGLPDPAAQTQVPKIMALAMLGRDADATACAEAAQRELRAHGNLRAAARVSQNLAGMQLRGDHYHEAARHYREASALFARLGDHEYSVLADIGQGDALASLGDFDEALHYYARVRMRAANQGLERPLALADGAVALVDLARGRYREALAGFESARRRNEALGLPFDAAMAEKQLADVYLELRLLPDARALLDRAAARFRELESPADEAAALAQRGRAEALMGAAAADASFAAASSLYEAQGNEAGVAAVALARGELALAAGDAAAALRWANASAAAFERVGQADGQARAQVVRGQALLRQGAIAQASDVFAATLAAARDRQQIQVQVRCLTGQGLAAEAAGRAQAAHEAFEAAIDLFEVQRAALPGDELRSAFLSDHLAPYLGRLRAAVAAGDAAATLAQLERCRARSLAQRLDDEAALEDDEDTIALRERLNWLYRRVQRLQDDGEASAAVDAEVLDTERELLERARRRRLLLPAAGASGAATLGVADIGAALHPGDALVAYGVCEGELLACVVTAAGITLHRSMAPWAEVAESMRAARFQIDALRHGQVAVQAHLPQLERRMAQRLARLHAQVWSPLEAALERCERVLVVPHGALGALPFAALAGDADPLGLRLEIAVVPSVRAALRGLARPPAAARRVVALGDSVRLAHADAEARSVAASFDHGTCLVGEEATVNALATHAPQADVLHLACHGQFRGDNPRFSALHLHDAPLTVERAETLSLNSATVVLSACETGLSEEATGDEMVGLVRAFLVAGASRVVASQWPVDDAVTARFMAAFYAALVRGDGAAVALREAQLEIRASHPHPFFWAAFTLYGGW